MHIFKHFWTITHHRHLVIKYCAKLGIFWQGLLHDLSKYGPTEFFEGAKYYVGFRSPTEGARQEHGYSKAWMHHKGRNKHHFEYWTDINNETRKYEPVKMPIRYVKEMLADRMAASKTYLKEKYTDSSPLDYFNSHNARDKMHPDTCNLLESWLILLSNEGEKAALKKIKKEFKNKQDY